MNHQTLTGTRGLDLYVLSDKGEWRYLASGLPSLNSKDCEQKVVGSMEAKWREYMLYLPLYDGLTKLEVGVDAQAVLEAPKVDLPRHDKPIVMYGTSILQGGCANRPGMAHTSILSRRFNREVINLGFSGNALLDLEINVAQCPYILAIGFLGTVVDGTNLQIGVFAAKDTGLPPTVEVVGNGARGDES